MKLRASIGKLHPAEVTKEWEGDFAGFVKALIPKNVPVTDDKASAGWVCGVHFKPDYRHSENFVARHFLSLDYDHLKPEDIDKIISGVCRSSAFLAYTTWSHTSSNPRIRVWVPLSRGVSSDEFQAVSRRFAGRENLIELAARESHTPCQFMYRPSKSPHGEWQVWSDTESPYLDVDKVLGEYDGDWKDKSRWPRRRDGDELFDTNDVASPLSKPGLVGSFSRAFTITEAITRFDLPYRPGSSETRWTYSGGSRADGAVAYDDDTKLHSYHDTDPARGQHNAYDLVRLHRFGNLDAWDNDTPIEARPSTRAMEDFCRGLPEFADLLSAGFTSLEETDGAGPAPAVAQRDGFLPDAVNRAHSYITDLANAGRIQRAFGRQILAVAGNFYVWQETHWKLDTHKGQIARKIADLGKLIRADYASLKSKKEAEGALTEDDEKELGAMWAFAIKCEDKSRMDACRELLRELLDFDATKLNSHRQLFNARNCTVNLETGETHRHNPEDFLTACAPTDYDPAAECPRFEQFISEIFQDDAATVAFVKRWFGYCITGESREQSLVFHVGKGGNGKSTLMRVLGHVLGGYAAMGPRSLLNGNGQIKNDVAALVGKRMVTLNETKQNEEFDQAQLKELTGGDTLTARFLHKEFFDFNPTHKLQIFTNHEPTIIGDDGGMWRRMLLLRYNMRYGTAAQVASGEYQKLRDEKLEELLKLEAPGILRWLVDGAKDWYANKLQAPVSVLKATADLRDEQDLMGQFLKERTVKDPTAKVVASNSTESLYTAYKGWITENGHRPFGRNRFIKAVTEALPSVRYQPWKEKGEWHRGFVGIRLVRNGDLTA